MVRHPFASSLLGTRSLRSLGGLGVLGLFATLHACSAASGVPIDGNDPGPGATTNACFEGAPCLGGFCSDDGFCRSETTSLPAVLLEVTAPAGTPSIAGLRYMVSVGELPESGSIDVGLGYISRIDASVRGTTIPREQCVPPSGDLAAGTAADGSMAARVTLIPRESQLGLPSPIYSKETVTDETGSYRADLVAPPGHYDIHVEPLGIDGACVRSPYLAVNRELTSGNIGLNLQLPVPARLDLTVIYPGYIDALSQWQVDIVDRATGKVLSNRVLLKDPIGGGAQLEYSAALAFSPVDDDSAPATELVRLSPPEDVTAPTIYLERSVVELFVAGEGVIDQLVSLPSPVVYTGRVNQRDSADPAPGTVTLVATELTSISSGLVAAFSRTVQTDESGVFEVELLPGKYQVLMEPRSDELAQTATELTVSSGSGNQVGKVLAVGRRASVAGTLVSLSGARVHGVPIEAYPPAVSGDLDVIAAVRGVGNLVPRAELVMPVGAEAEVTDTGTFALLADPGSFHLIARPDVSTGFAWGFALGLDVASKNIGLPDIVLSPPFVLEGEVSSSDVGLVPGALVRAYAYVEGSAFSSEIEDATSVVAVGEARADAHGRYRLLLPSVAP